MAKKKIILEQDNDSAHLSGKVYSLTDKKSERFESVQSLNWVNNGDNTFSKGEYIMQPLHTINGIEYHVTDLSGVTETFGSLAAVNENY